MTTASARARAPWSDVRFVIGIVLIVGSIAGVWLTVAAARQTIPVLAAARVLLPGERVGPDDVRVVDVALGATETAYLAADALPGGAVVDRVVSEGELLPVGALADGDSADVTNVVVGSTGDVPAGVVVGSVVEVWVARPDEAGVLQRPEVLLSDAVVARIDTDESMIGGGEPVIELIVARGEVAAVLEASHSDAVLSVVPGAAG